MGHATNPHADAEHAHLAGHAHANEEVETAEMKAEREASAATQGAIARSLATRVAPVLVIVGAGVTLALLSNLSTSSAPLAWLWLLPSVFVTCWAFALRG